MAQAKYRHCVICDNVRATHLPMDCPSGVDLYHATKVDNISNNPIQSNNGRLGPGVYFAGENVARALSAHKGYGACQCVIKCRVRLGNMKDLGHAIDHKGSWRSSYDSCCGIHPTWLNIPAFTEYCIKDPSKCVIKEVNIVNGTVNGNINLPNVTIRVQGNVTFKGSIVAGTLCLGSVENITEHQKSCKASEPMADTKSKTTPPSLPIFVDFDDENEMSKGIDVTLSSDNPLQREDYHQFIEIIKDIRSSKLTLNTSFLANHLKSKNRAVSETLIFVIHGFAECLRIHNKQILQEIKTAIECQTYQPGGIGEDAQKLQQFPIWHHLNECVRGSFKMANGFLRVRDDFIIVLMNIMWKSDDLETKRSVIQRLKDNIGKIKHEEWRIDTGAYSEDPIFQSLSEINKILPGKKYFDSLLQNLPATLNEINECVEELNAEYREFQQAHNRRKQEIEEKRVQLANQKVLIDEERRKFEQARDANNYDLAKTYCDRINALTLSHNEMVGVVEKLTQKLNECTAEFENSMIPKKEALNRKKMEYHSMLKNIKAAREKTGIHGDNLIGEFLGKINDLTALLPRMCSRLGMFEDLISLFSELLLRMDGPTVQWFCQQLGLDELIDILHGKDIFYINDLNQRYEQHGGFWDNELLPHIQQKLGRPLKRGEERKLRRLCEMKQTEHELNADLLNEIQNIIDDGLKKATITETPATGGEKQSTQTQTGNTANNAADTDSTAYSSSASSGSSISAINTNCNRRDDDDDKEDPNKRRPGQRDLCGDDCPKCNCKKKQQRKSDDDQKQSPQNRNKVTSEHMPTTKKALNPNAVDFDPNAPRLPPKDDDDAKERLPPIDEEHPSQSNLDDDDAKERLSQPPKPQLPVLPFAMVPCNFAQSNTYLMPPPPPPIHFAPYNPTLFTNSWPIHPFANSVYAPPQQSMPLFCSAWTMSATAANLTASATSDSSPQIASKLHKLGQPNLKGANARNSDSDYKSADSSKAYPSPSTKNVFISKKLRDTIIPIKITRSIHSLCYLRKTLPSCVSGAIRRNQQLVCVVNYDFRHIETREPLYCVIVSECRGGGKWKWSMIEELFSKSQLRRTFSISDQRIPRKIPITSNIKNISHSDWHTLVQTTKWHKNVVPIFAVKENKQRLTLSVTPEELRKALLNGIARDTFDVMIGQDAGTAFICKALIVTVECKRITFDVAICISSTNDTLTVRGMFIHEQLLKEAHVLAAPDHHDCKCIDGFNEAVDELYIGNPDDDRNKINALRKEVERYKSMSRMAGYSSPDSTSSASSTPKQCQDGS